MNSTVCSGMSAEQQSKLSTSCNLPILSRNALRHGLAQSYTSADAHLEVDGMIFSMKNTFLHIGDGSSSEDDEPKRRKTIGCCKQRSFTQSGFVRASSLEFVEMASPKILSSVAATPNFFDDEENAMTVCLDVISDSPANMTPTTSAFPCIPTPNVFDDVFADSFHAPAHCELRRHSSMNSLVCNEIDLTEFLCIKNTFLACVPESLASEDSDDEEQPRSIRSKSTPSDWKLNAFELISDSASEGEVAKLEKGLLALGESVAHSNNDYVQFLWRVDLRRRKANGRCGMSRHFNAEIDGRTLRFAMHIDPIKAEEVEGGKRRRRRRSNEASFRSTRTYANVSVHCLSTDLDLSGPLQIFVESEEQTCTLAEAHDFAIYPRCMGNVQETSWELPEDDSWTVGLRLKSFDSKQM